ncbi:hypothetical protein [Thiococcus pfennigii]|uniref:hypothetical protein n=1 Tax=Thiococcus pfennigii TaxID=1057 RepID=UPI00190845CB|nr:hypothetical protein [Thiococcus pfennigii]MBK1700018.1 hypothetical protein [Thiococcus pfennigii]MBK1731190.1 hypothetical protein [Thiococcus pfennigii]
MPVVIVMGFDATPGGNATLVGASANTVSVGICIREAGQVSVVGFARRGVPITFVQRGLRRKYLMRAGRNQKRR